MSKEVTDMTTEEINSERNELEPMVLLMKEINIVEQASIGKRIDSTELFPASEGFFAYQGINYFDIAKRYNELCKESVVRELLNQNKDE